MTEVHESQNIDVYITDKGLKLTKYLINAIALRKKKRWHRRPLYVACQ